MKLYVQFRVFSSKLIAVLLMLMAMLLLFSAGSTFLSVFFIVCSLISLWSNCYLLGFSKDRAVSTIESTLTMLSIAFQSSEEGIRLQTKDVLFQCLPLGTLSLFRLKYGDEVLKEGRAIEAVMVKRLKS